MNSVDAHTLRRVLRRATARCGEMAGSRIGNGLHTKGLPAVITAQGREWKLPCNFGAYPPPPGDRGDPLCSRGTHRMAPVLQVEPLRNAVVALAGIIVVLTLLLITQRMVAAVSTARN